MLQDRQVDLVFGVLEEQLAYRRRQRRMVRQADPDRDVRVHGQGRRLVVGELCIPGQHRSGPRVAQELRLEVGGRLRVPGRDRGGAYRRIGIGEQRAVHVGGRVEPAARGGGTDHRVVVGGQFGSGHAEQLLQLADREVAVVDEPLPWRVAPGLPHDGDRMLGELPGLDRRHVAPPAQ
ncbi:hypothetical protein ACFQZ4_08695 [Catellatospora coxensis]